MKNERNTRETRKEGANGAEPEGVGTLERERERERERRRETHTYICIYISLRNFRGVAHVRENVTPWLFRRKFKFHGIEASDSPGPGLSV